MKKIKKNIKKIFIVLFTVILLQSTFVTNFPQQKTISTYSLPEPDDTHYGY